MDNTVYSNFVLEAKLNDLLNTKLATRSFMTIDDSLTDAEGTLKKINKYTYAGSVEAVAEGSGNSEEAIGVITFTPSTYEVAVAQHTFKYTDEQFMQDAKVLEYGVEGGATIMTNDMNSKFFAELAKASLSQTYETAISYDVVVDAISKMNLEDESGLFLIIGTDSKAAIRKDEDFKSAQLGEIIFNGQIGSIAGVPVVVSKLCPEGEAYLASPEAVTLFTKKDSQVEQARNAETRMNTVVMRKVNLVALTDATKVVKIVSDEDASI